MAGHTVELDENVYLKLKNHCLNAVKENRDIPVDELVVEMMDFPEIPMHYPYHHFIFPAALITMASIDKGEQIDNVEAMLDVCIARAKNVLGGFCGNYGNCGAGVAAGLFISIFTGASPLSDVTWQWANEATGRALLKISEIPGPRCCKRTGFLSLEETVAFANEKIGTNLKVSEKIKCKYSDRNKECKRELCPYYNKEEK